MHAQPDIYWNRLQRQLASRVQTRQPAWKEFRSRLETHFADLLTVFLTLYGNRPDAVWELEELLVVLYDAFVTGRAEESVDPRHDETPWYLESSVVGAMCYTERFAGTVQGIISHLDYLEDLGIRYLHLMPPFLCPEKRNDGGYAVSSYRELRPDLGHIDDIRELSRRMHTRGMKLVLDFVFNHTSDEHEWARKALEGDPRYADHYFLFPDRRLPDAYDQHLREIFPEGKRGSFVFHETSGQWVWSTFNPYQWDLNYRSPVVFRDMVGEMLFLANLGVDVLRLDALAFTWKEPGTSCENLPRVHTLIRAFKTAARIAAPSLEFKSEAIVHPDDVVKYIDVRECALSYNPLFMALSWESVATQSSELLLKSLRTRFSLPKDCAWVNYVRSHDDIGWTFADEDASELGIHASDHRSFLNHFFTDRFPGSYAAGLPFQLNPVNGDCRVCGTTASLAGVEKGVKSGDESLIRRGVQRILLLHAMMFTAGGIPLLYLGDEFGQLNDYSFQEDPDTRDDSRWVHRPRFDWDAARENVSDSSDSTWSAMVSNGIRKLIRIRASRYFPQGSETEFLDIGSRHAAGILHTDGMTSVCGLFNLCEQRCPVRVPAHIGFPDRLYDAWSGETVDAGADLILEPLGFLLLTPASTHDEAHKVV